MEKILITDLLKLKVQNYFSFKSYASLLKIETGEAVKSKCFVKVKFELDYYISDSNFYVIDIDFKNKTANGYLNLNNI